MDLGSLMGRMRERELLLDGRVRLAGSIVLLLWFFHFVRYVWVLRQPEQMLWMCHTSTLLLALGLLASSASAVRVGALWSVGGFPLWVLDVVLRGETTRVSVLSHILVPLLGVAALTQVRWRGRVVLGAIGFHALCWALARALGTPQGNVNLAHQVYDIFGTQIVRSYWLYLAVTSAAMWGALALIALVLARRFAPDAELLAVAPELAAAARVVERAAPEPEPEPAANAEPGFRLAPKISPEQRKAWLEQQRRGAGRTSSPPRAFTLMEMMVVVSILAVLAAIAVPDLTPAVHNAKLRAQIDEVASFIENARRSARGEGRCYRVVQTGASLQMQRRGNADCYTPVNGTLSGGGWSAVAATLTPPAGFTYTLQSVPNELVFRPSGRVRGDGDLDVTDDGARVVIQYARIPQRHVEVLITSQGRLCPLINAGAPVAISVPVVCGTGFGADGAGGGGGGGVAGVAGGGGLGGGGGCG
ncbi:MAG: prepilin-type N-terminal cleavage/methylation domain-containing protein [Deltaproteobacteria bacterium]|nr:prepilin-type N-terminal cleavage/methylation domain-containing protein [Deltaproteobacteria bacterium]